MEIVLKLKNEIAKELHRGQSNLPETKRLRIAAEELSVTLQPLHGESNDLEMASYFTVVVPDSTADSVRQQLETCDGVTAAYTKPAGEPP